MRGVHHLRAADRTVATVRCFAVLLGLITTLPVDGLFGAVALWWPYALWAALASVIVSVDGTSFARARTNLWIADVVIISALRWIRPDPGVEAFYVLVGMALWSGVVGRGRGVALVVAASSISFGLQPAQLSDGAEQHPAVSALLMGLFSAIAWAATARHNRSVRRLDAIQTESNMRAAVLRTVMENDRRAVVIHDSHGDVVDCNEAGRELIRAGLHDLIASSPIDNAGGRLSPEAWPEFRARITGSVIEQQVRVTLRPDGHRWFGVTATPVDTEEGKWVVASYDDVTAQIDQVSELRSASELDSLTGIGNRRYLDRTIGEFAAHGTPVTAVLVDLDNFKEINDTLGHAVGDSILVEAAHRLDALSREGTAVIRLGGDEFVLLAVGLHSHSVDPYVARIRNALATPYVTEQGFLTVGASIGAHLGDCDDIRGSMQRADEAMYADKRVSR